MALLNTFKVGDGTLVGTGSSGGGTGTSVSYAQYVLDRRRRAGGAMSLPARRRRRRG